MIKSSKNFISLKGSVKSTKSYTDEESEKAVSAYFRKSYNIKTSYTGKIKNVVTRTP